MNREVAAARIQGSSVKLYDSKGINICTLPAAGAVSADVTGNSVAIKLKNGAVKIYNAKGRHVRNV